jgi:hypothetical protein
MPPRMPECSPCEIQVAKNTNEAANNPHADAGCHGATDRQSEELLRTGRVRVSPR